MLKEIRDLFKDDSIQKTLTPYNGFQIHLTNFEIKASIIFLKVSFIEKLVRKYPNINFGEYRELCDKLINSKVLFDKEHLISPYKNQVKKIPDTLKKRIIEMNYYNLRYYFIKGEIQLDGERGNWIMVNQRIHQSVEKLLTLIYLLNNKTLITPRWVFKEIKELKIKPANLLKNLENLSKLKNNKQDLEDKIKIFRKMLTYLSPFVKNVGIEI